MNTNEASLERSTVQTYSSREKRAFDGVLFSMECTARWLENASDPMQAAAEIRLAMAELRNRIADCESVSDPVIPTLYQYRTKPTWHGGRWCAWTECSAAAAADYRRVPLLHDWVYEVRELFEHPAPQPVQTQVALTDDARDAARYRWLRDFNVRCKDGVNINPPCEHVHASMYSHAVGTIPAVRLETGEELDRAIDAALLASQSASGGQA
jgi:hypothetical protein